MKPLLRDARADDIQALHRLIDQLGHPIEHDQLDRNLQRLIECGLPPIVAEVGGAVVGLCTISVMEVLHRPTPVGRLSTLVVDRDQRGRGIGAALVTEAERRLATKGCALVEVTSNERRMSTHRFYLELGYERTSLRFAKKI